MGNKVKGAVEAPKSVKIGAGGGSMGETTPDPDPTVSGKPQEGQTAVSGSRKAGDAPMAGTNMQGAPGNPSAARAGEQDTSKAYSTVKNVSTGNTDF